MTAAVTAATEFQAVDVDYAAIAPMLIVVAGSLVGVLVEAFAPRRSRHGIQVWFTTLVLVGAFAALLVWSRDSMTVTLGGSVVVDGVSVFLMGALLLLAVISVLIMAETVRRRRRRRVHPDGRLDPRARTRRTSRPAPGTPPPRSSRSPCSRCSA